jgi:hypothetical protein
LSRPRGSTRNSKRLPSGDWARCWRKALATVRMEETGSQVTSCYLKNMESPRCNRAAGKLTRRREAKSVTSGNGLRRETDSMTTTIKLIESDGHKPTDAERSHRALRALAADVRRAGVRLQCLSAEVGRNWWSWLAYWASRRKGSMCWLPVVAWAARRRWREARRRLGEANLSTMVDTLPREARTRLGRGPGSQHG